MQVSACIAVEVLIGIFRIFRSMPNFVQCNQDAGLRDFATPKSECVEDHMGQGIHLADRGFCVAMKRRLLE